MITTDYDYIFILLTTNTAIAIQKRKFPSLQTNVRVGWKSVYLLP